MSKFDWTDGPWNFWDGCGRVAKAIVAVLAVVACLLAAWLIVGALT